MRAQRCKAPPGGAPRPRPYLWPTSLPTEPPPRVGSSGLSPCGSSGAEAPAGAPPGPALPSDGERGSLARAILPKRTAAAAGGGRRVAAEERALPSPRAAPRSPRRRRSGTAEGGWETGGGRAPSRRGPGAPRLGRLPTPEAGCAEDAPRGRRVLAPQASRGCLTTEVVVIVMLPVTALGGEEE